MLQGPEEPGLRVRQLTIYSCVALGGLAALSWEVVWQLKSSLAIGLSAVGTAITLAVTMGGMSLGSILMAGLLKRHPTKTPLRVYGILELTIGLSGLLLNIGFAAIDTVDVFVFRNVPGCSPMVHFLGIALLLGPPTLAMGATIPVLGLIARQQRMSIALLYGTNVAGASIGVVLMAFALLPELGVWLSSQLLTVVNIGVCLVIWLLGRPDSEIEPPEDPSRESPATDIEGLSHQLSCWIVGLTGFVTFGLEVAWFRALRSALKSTSFSFAIMLASVLIPLSLSASSVPYLQRRRVPLGFLLTAATVAILLATPLIERLDLFTTVDGTYWQALPIWLGVSLALLGVPMLFLGTALPWLLERQRSAQAWGKLYSLNTLGAIAGSLAGAWLLLPNLGLAKTSWAIGLLLGVISVASFKGRSRLFSLLACALALVVAMGFESGIGHQRVVGAISKDSYKILDYEEAPDSTVSVVELQTGERFLVIDGFIAAGQQWTYAYMHWMGRLPMLLHPDPQHALVICFGTGQTANAVRLEEPQKLDLVDLNRAVFGKADFFPANGGVLRDPRTRAIVMDGRAWLRRTRQSYDVITLEPMPPNFVGINALYSKEFYELMTKRLNPGGVVAQWLPLHLVHPIHAASIAATFQSVFPDSVLWVDPLSFTGVLLGRFGERSEGFGTRWPGLARRRADSDVQRRKITDSIHLDREGLMRYGKLGRIITDDNQLLSYDRHQWSMTRTGATPEFNRELIDRVKQGEIDLHFGR